MLKFGPHQTGLHKVGVVDIVHANAMQVTTLLQSAMRRRWLCPCDRVTASVALSGVEGKESLDAILKDGLLLIIVRAACVDCFFEGFPTNRMASLITFPKGFPPPAAEDSSLIVKDFSGH